MELQATIVSYRVEKVGQGGVDERRRPVPSLLGVSPYYYCYFEMTLTCTLSRS